MPLIQVRVIENVFTPEQRSQFISKLTDAMVLIEGENMCPVTSVVIEEVRSTQSGIGGQAVTTDAVHALEVAHGGLPHEISKKPVRDPVQQKSTPLDPEAIEKMQEVLRARTPDGWA
jgi:4-oxalocrotonate tautomerase